MKVGQAGSKTMVLLTILMIRKVKMLFIVMINAGQYNNMNSNAVAF